MSFIETEASYRIEVINGKPVKIITPQTEITLTNTKTGQDYNSDAEAMQELTNIARIVASSYLDLFAASHSA